MKNDHVIIGFALMALAIVFVYFHSKQTTVVENQTPDDTLKINPVQAVSPATLAKAIGQGKQPTHGCGCQKSCADQSVQFVSMDAFEHASNNNAASYD